MARVTMNECIEIWDINCIECGKYILTEGWAEVSGDISCVAGSYDNGFYTPDGFLCNECAKKRGLNGGNFMKKKVCQTVKSVITEYNMILEEAVDKIEHKSKVKPFSILECQNEEEISKMKRIQECVEVMKDTMSRNR